MSLSSEERLNVVVTGVQAGQVMGMLEKGQGGQKVSGSDVTKEFSCSRLSYLTTE